MKYAILILTACLLTGCSNYNQVVNSWIGVDFNEVIAAWGPPAQVLDDGNGGKIASWVEDGSIQMPGTAETSLLGTTAYTYHRPGQTWNFRRTTTFWLNKQGIVYRGSYRDI